jgi:uncharacterized protein
MVASPCINICQMDAHSGLCRGCFRTIEEITAWTRINDAARQQILAAVLTRRQQAVKPGTAPLSPEPCHD